MYLKKEGDYRKWHPLEYFFLYRDKILRYYETDNHCRQPTEILERVGIE
jgi:hypothetical protein